MNRALTHRSALPELDESRANEQLEFLGDAILDMIVVDYLFRRYPDKREGELSKLKSLSVSGRSLQAIARRIGLGRFIIMSRNEARNGGRKRSSILEDTLEAVVGAIYLDGGLNSAKKFFLRTILPPAEAMIREKVDYNYKSQLLELAQARNWKMPMYKVVGERGPDHLKEFEIEVILNGDPVGVGRGANKKDAQQLAAQAALKGLLSI